MRLRKGEKMRGIGRALVGGGGNEREQVQRLTLVRRAHADEPRQSDRGAMPAGLKLIPHHRDDGGDGSVRGRSNRRRRPSVGIELTAQRRVRITAHRRNRRMDQAREHWPRQRAEVGRRVPVLGPPLIAVTADRWWPKY